MVAVGSPCGGELLFVPTYGGSGLPLSGESSCPVCTGDWHWGVSLAVTTTLPLPYYGVEGIGYV